MKLLLFPPSSSCFPLATISNKRLRMQFSSCNRPRYGNSENKKKRMTVICNSNGQMKQKMVSTSQDAGSCLITTPPRGVKPRAIVKLLGGAFIGAIPQLTYGYLTELLAKEGYLVIAVPYNVTFDHAQATTEVFQRFNACLDSILASGLPNFNLTSTDLVHLPLYSVGHSNGALLQVLAGSYFEEKIPKANVIISFNNRPATEAVPYFEQLGPFVSQMTPMVEASPVYPMAKGASDAWKALRDVAASLVNYDTESVTILEKFVDQLPSVLDQVAQGISEFKPTPLENRQLVGQSYNVRRTLLVKFNNDAIDETDLLEAALRPRIESIDGRLEKITLYGTHVTPCLQVMLVFFDDCTADALISLMHRTICRAKLAIAVSQGPVWQVGSLYTPADAIFQGLKTVLLNDTKALSRTICRWLEQVYTN